MNPEQNKFYTSISKYYSEIFPYNPMQLQFVKSRAGELTGKQILDIGCAAGELAFNLALQGAKVTGIDLNEDLLRQAKSKKIHPELHFQKGDMLELKNDFQKGRFDSVLCFGNTLVHLPTLELIQKMLEGVISVLKPGGKFLLQILNYDYILKERVTDLPLIENKNIQFIRKYRLEENNPVIGFQTNLVLKKENQTISNETMLFALKSSELVQLLKKAGFSEIKLYSNFKLEPFGGNHLPLIMAGKNPNKY